MERFGNGEVQVVDELLCSIGRVEATALCRRWVEISDAAAEGALPFHPHGFFNRLV
jgi:hypothetical protein